jgi:hypothetical protein
MWCGAVVILVPFIGLEAVGDSRTAGRIDADEWIFIAFIASVSRREGIRLVRRFAGEEKRQCNYSAPRGTQDGHSAQRQWSAGLRQRQHCDLGDVRDTKPGWASCGR